MHAFLRTTQAISPAPRLQDNSEPVSGCAAILFDPSSTLVATRLDDSPGTVWIWDLQAAELRAVLLFHGNASSLTWHPNVPETLLIKCEGDQYNALVFVWDPLSEGPRSVDFGHHLPEVKLSRKHRISWLGLDAAMAPSLFFSDNHSFLLASLAEPDQAPPPWGDQDRLELGFADEPGEESPLELVPAALGASGVVDEDEDEEFSELEDTFVHKR